MFCGKGRLLVFESKRKVIKFEEHDGIFRDGIKDGLGKNLRLKESELYGDDEEFRKEILSSSVLEYQDFIGDFYNDRPVYHSGVLKNLKLPPSVPMPIYSSPKKVSTEAAKEKKDKKKKDKKKKKDRSSSSSSSSSDSDKSEKKKKKKKDKKEKKDKKDKKEKKEKKDKKEKKEDEDEGGSEKEEKKQKKEKKKKKESQEDDE